MKVAAFALVAYGLFSSVESAWADAFVLSNGSFTTFNIPGANPGTTVAAGVNGSGQIVGFSTIALVDMAFWIYMGFSPGLTFQTARSQKRGVLIMPARS
jgi:hypothetical protein